MLHSQVEADASVPPLPLNEQRGKREATKPLQCIFQNLSPKRLIFSQQYDKIVTEKVRDMTVLSVLRFCHTYYMTFSS